MKDDTNKRIYAVDALRGTAILLMLLANLEPPNGLPAWMFHSQSPPPTHTFNPEIAGLTWVDLIFPFFIFSMGAAIPFALSKHLKKGLQGIKIVYKIFKRGVFLLAFAIYAIHITPSTLGNHLDAKTCLLAIFFFFWAFTIWGQSYWIPSDVQKFIKIIGIIVVVFLFSGITYKDNGRFTVFRNDIILLVLSNLAVFGGLLWLITRKNILPRLGILAIFLAVRASCSIDGSWIQTLGNHSEIPFLSTFIKIKMQQSHLIYYRWIYDFSWFLQWRFLKYMFIVIPATIVGDIFQDSMESHTIHDKMGWSKIRFSTITVLMLVFIVTTLAGLQSRWVSKTFVAGIILGIICFLLLRNPKNKNDELTLKLFCWGFFWFILGLLFEPYENGIKKDPSTMSYYFVTTGLAIFTIIAFNILMNVFKLKKVLCVLIHNGQNPMIAYIAGPNLLIPLFILTGLYDNLFIFYDKNPWGGFILSSVFVLLVGLWVSLFTKCRIHLST